MSNQTERLNAALDGRYRILRHLGEGGMASVYLCEDVKHDRKVALKLLKPELAAVLGAERFVQEIKTTAALQHPHILPLFDSGAADGFLFYVMPFIDGETLRAKLDRETQLGVDDAVRIAREVLDALDYAHTRGIVHRDVKPENIMLHGGHAMVVDFGIALAVSAAAGGRMTETGLSLGTPHYMSPEQATAEKEITPRSDVYSLGSVLYEMLTGQPPHLGGSAQQIIMKIITEPADVVTKHRKSVPPNVAAAVATSLEKLPADRFESAKAFSEALANPAYTNVAFSATAARSAGGKARIWTRPFIAVSALAVAAVAVAGWALLRPTPALPVTATSLNFTAADAPTNGWDLAPDGSALAYAGGTGNGRLWIKHRDAAHAVSLQGTDSAFAPFFSPDGQWVGFFVQGGPFKLKKVPVRGGGVVTLAATGFAFGTWLDDGSIVLSAPDVGVRRIPEGGGTAETLLTLDSLGGRKPFGVAHLPGARGVLFNACASRGFPCVVWVLDLRTGKPKKLLAEGRDALYLATGHLLYRTEEGTVFAVPFDLKSLSVRGPTVPVLEGVGAFALSRDGTLLYGEKVAAGGLAPVWVTRNGHATPVDSSWTVGAAFSLAISPDGHRLALSITAASGESNIWVKELDHGPLDKLTFGGVDSSYARPAWSPDGRSLLYLPTPRGGPVYEKRADGTGAARILVENAKHAWVEATYSPDRTWLLLRSYDSTNVARRHIYARRTSGDTTLRELVVSTGDDGTPAVSPDGRWLAYASNETGRNEVYVRPFPNTADAKYRASVNGGAEPVWAHSGRELFFVDGADQLVAAEISTSPTFAVGRQQRLFSFAAFVHDEWGHSWAVAPDDRRFLTLQLPPTGGTGDLVMIENWLQVLKGKLRK